MSSETKGIAESSLGQLTLTRYREFFREPEAVFWVFVFPMLLTAGLGLAFMNRPAEVSKVGAGDARLAAALRGGKSLDVQQMNGSEALEALRTGRILLYATTGENGVIYRYDDTNPEARTARLLTDRAIQRSAGREDAVNVQEDLIREPGSRYIDFVVPGILGMNLMGSGIWGLGFTIVDSRRKKLLKRLVASPMPRWQYLLSFLLQRLTMLIVEVAVFVGFAVLVFGVPVRGTVWELAIICLLSSLAFSAVGLLIACRVRTIEGVSGLMNLVMVPMWILSGVFFSAERFPDFLQPFIRSLPLTAVIDALRGHMIQGLHLHQMTWQMSVITAWLVICFFTAMRLFRWK